jgi:hypothetical protein
VAGNVAHKKIQMIAVKRADQAEVAANRTHRMIKSFHIQTAPGERFRRKALLHAGCEREVLFDFFLPLFQKFVGGAQLFLGAFLLGDIREADYRESAPVRVFHIPRAGDDR